MSLQQPAKKVPKHLIDPATLQPDAVRKRLRERDPEEHAAELARLARVKEWVTSALVVTTMFHLSVGLVIAAIFIDSDKTAARVGLNVIAGILWIAGIAGARAIHHKNPVSPWLLLSVVVPAVGLYLTFH